jgi:DNA-binding NarL/FixJ family response regulator
LMDIGIPGISGISLTSKIKQKNPGIKIIMLSADKSEYSISEAIKSGADGYLHKDTSVDEIKKAIRSVKNNKEYFGNSISGSVFRSYANKIREGKKHASKSLSDREIEIVRYISEGLTYKEIGNKLHISTRTVESHKNNILQKLDVKTIPELIKAAIKHNYINPELS